MAEESLKGGLVLVVLRLVADVIAVATGAIPSSSSGIQKAPGMNGGKDTTSLSRRARYRPEDELESIGCVGASGLRQ